MKKRILVTAVIMATTFVLPICGHAVEPAIVPITLGTDAIAWLRVPEASDKMIITDTDKKLGGEPSKIKVTFTVLNNTPVETSDGTDINFLDANHIAVTPPPDIFGYCKIDIFVDGNKVYTGLIELKQLNLSSTSLIINSVFFINDNKSILVTGKGFGTNINVFLNNNKIENNEMQFSDNGNVLIIKLPNIINSTSWLNIVDGKNRDQYLFNIPLPTSQKVIITSVETTYDIKSGYTVAIGGNGFGDDPKKMTIYVDGTKIDKITERSDGIRLITLPDGIQSPVLLKVEVNGSCDQYIINLAKQNVSINPWRVLLTKPLTINLSEYVTSTIGTIDKNGSFTPNSQNGNSSQHYAAISYLLPLSSITNPHGDAKPSLMDNIQLYATGSYQSALTLPDSASTIQIGKTLNYSAGIQFKATVDEILFPVNSQTK